MTKCDDLPLPRYMSSGASGVDVVAAIDKPVVIEPGSIALIPTGLRVAVPEGYEIQVRARSGLALKHGLMLVNGIGTIDSDYRGEVGVIMGNVSRKPFTVERGMRIAQLVCIQVARMHFEPTDELAATARGADGFGSTGHAS